MPVTVSTNPSSFPSGPGTAAGETAGAVSVRRVGDNPPGQEALSPPGAFRGQGLRALPLPVVVQRAASYSQIATESKMAFRIGVRCSSAGRRFGAVLVTYSAGWRFRRKGVMCTELINTPDMAHLVAGVRFGLWYSGSKPFVVDRAFPLALIELSGTARGRSFNPRVPESTAYCSAPRGTRGIPPRWGR